MIDKLDERLIRELDKDSRQSYAALAKKVSAPQETVRYRVQSMIDNGAIVSFYTVVDPGRMGAGVHKVLMKLHNVDEKRVENIVDYLVKSSSVNWVVRLDGVFDIAFTIWIEKIRELSSFVSELRSHYYKYISRIAFATNIEAEFYIRTRGSRTKAEVQGGRYGAALTAEKLDSLDWMILREIGASSRKPASEIASKCGISTGTVLSRLRRLEREKVITGYRVVVDNAVLDRVNYYVLVYLHHVSERRLHKFADYCRSHRLINYVIRVLGEWDYELNIEAKDFYEYRSLMMEMTTEFSDIVRDYYGMPVTKIAKFCIFP